MCLRDLVTDGLHCGCQSWARFCNWGIPTYQNVFSLMLAFFPKKGCLDGAWGAGIRLLPLSESRPLGEGCRGVLYFIYWLLLNSLSQAVYSVLRYRTLWYSLSGKQASSHRVLTASNMALQRILCFGPTCPSTFRFIWTLPKFYRGNHLLLYNS